jgi:hypothetical protein
VRLKGTVVIHAGFAELVKEEGLTERVLKITIGVRYAGRPTVGYFVRKRLNTIVELENPMLYRESPSPAKARATNIFVIGARAKFSKVIKA